MENIMGWSEESLGGCQARVGRRGDHDFEVRQLAVELSYQPARGTDLAQADTMNPDDGLETIASRNLAQPLRPAATISAIANHSHQQHRRSH